MASLITSSIRAFWLLSILAFSLLIPTVRSQDNAFLNEVCSNTSQTQNSSFSTDLKNFLKILYNNTPTSYGYLGFPYGPINHPVVYGLALCRGDLREDLCKQCLYDAMGKITNNCNKTTAMVWYDYCHMKYSDEKFLGEIDKVTHFNVSGGFYNLSIHEAKKFKQSSIELLSNLANTTANSEHLFAKNQKLFDENNNITIYGMAQCTRDLVPEKCKMCLDHATKQLPIYNGSIYSTGQRVFTGSCSLRYDTHGFLISQ